MEVQEFPAFCPPNISISDIWVNHGVSHCFMDTVSSSVIGGFILLCGMIQLVIYRKYSTQIEPRRIRPSFFYKFQIFLMLLLPILVAVRLDLRWKYYDGGAIYGYMVSHGELQENNKTDSLSFPDPPRSIHNLLVLLCHLPDCERATLPASIRSDSRARHCLAHVFHSQFHRSKCCPCQHQQQRLVV